MKPLSKAITVFEFTIKWAAAAAGIILILTMLSVSLNVFLRYAFNISLEWVVELSEYSLLYIAFLGAAWVHQENKHVNIDLIVNWLNPKSRAFLTLTISIITVIVCMLLVYFGIRIIWFYLVTGSRYESTLGLPRAAISVIIPFGSFLFFLEGVRKLCELLGRDKA